MQQNNIEEIRKQILKKYNLRIRERINYDLLNTIYQEYVEFFDEKTFAQEVLQISYESYCKIKYHSNKRAILLKDEKIDIDLVREEILQRYSLRPGDKINYQKLCEIARQYEQIVDESTIAYKVLGISRKMLSPIRKNPNHSTTILSDKFEQNIDDLRMEILKNEEVSPGDYINFDQLNRIAKKYKINDRDLAIKIFGIKGFNYDNIKNNHNRRTKILFGITAKNENKYDRKLEELRNEIIKSEKLIPGSKMNYEQIHRIYIKYSSTMAEVSFAVSILGLSKTRFFNIKSNKKDRAVILKDMLDVAIKQVREQLIQEERIEPGDSINYERLTVLIERWKETIDETVLVRNVLGLSLEVVKKMKVMPNQKSIIMRDLVKKKTEEEINSLRNQIFENEDIKPGITISYEDFLLLYEKYKNIIGEREFALRVLLIPQDKYSRIKRNAKNKVTICKELVEELGQSELDYIRQVVYNEYGIIEGNRINYERLARIAERWSDKISEKDFACKILGISAKSYYKMKYDNTKQSYMLNPRIKERADKIRYIIRKENRFYTLEEINDICTKNELTIDEFCSYVVQREMHNKVYMERNFYIELLQRKGKIFIGKGERITREFAKKNQQLIIDFARSLAVELCVTYQAKHNIEDYAQDTMLYIIENCGDLEKNFEDDFELCKGLIYMRAKAFIKGIIIVGKKAKTISADQYYINRKDNSLSIKSQDEDVEIAVIDKIEAESNRDAIINRVLVCIENGADPIEAIRKIADVNGLEFQDLINQFREYYKNIDRQERD